MAKVLWRDAQGREGSVELGPTPTLIGRAEECAIRSDDAMVSRHHARIFSSGGGWLVEDLGSSNGMFYQEQRLTRHRLSHGDAVRCGSLWLRFLDEQAAASSPQAPPPHHTGPAIGVPEGDPTHGMKPVRPNRETSQVPPAGASEANEEIAFLRRRVEQLKADLRIARGGGASAKKFEDVQEELVRMTAERDELVEKVSALEGQIASEGGDVKVQRAGAIAETAGEVVVGLNDVLSNLRINVMAAEGEFEQFHDDIPRASYELIREALRSSADDMDNARDLLRKLRELAGVD